MTANRIKASRLRLWGVAMLAPALLSLAGAAQAQAVCTTHNEITQHLENKFGESPIAVALANNGALVELFSTGDGATWTMVLTTPMGVSCVLVSGEALDMRRQVAQGPET